MKITLRHITFTAIFTALTAALSSVKIPLGFTNLYLTDIAVCMAGIILEPFFAVIAGAGGAFLGDLMFYPQAMVVTLIVRAVQTLIISVFSHYVLKKKPALSSTLGCIIGIFIMAFGYSYFAVLFYGSIEYALAKLPLEALQATVGAVVALPLCYKFHIREICKSYLKKDTNGNQ